MGARPCKVKLRRHHLSARFIAGSPEKARPNKRPSASHKRPLSKGNAQGVRQNLVERRRAVAVCTVLIARFKNPSIPVAQSHRLNVTRRRSLKGCSRTISDSHCGRCSRTGKSQPTTAFALAADLAQWLFEEFRDATKAPRVSDAVHRTGDVVWRCGQPPRRQNGQRIRLHIAPEGRFRVQFRPPQCPSVVAPANRRSTREVTADAIDSTQNSKTHGPKNVGANKAAKLKTLWSRAEHMAFDNETRS
ncbi:hypothetical protein SAMN05444581_1409 [Methylocapsa palsarum]|uniref:Uncharacterized protein n=1 Tax=Methylocapsa palsarum TaxID=1612308 RepID=A0A1I4D6R1_9HYPH|nr:hypothetical protein SAMN05444581_1409 [Methylocapsa palsarum]